MRRALYLLFTFLTFLFCSTLILQPVAVQCAPITTSQLPDELKQWQQWVLFDHQERLCTPLWQQKVNGKTTGQLRQCRWPGALTLTLNNDGGTFKQYWELDRDGWIVVPGSGKYWPQQVTIDGKTALVMRNATADTAAGRVAGSEDRPVVYARAGKHLIKGSFSWQRLPQNLPVDKNCALIKLTCNGTFVHQVQLERNGLLWLHGERTTSGKSLQNQLQFKVFRRITDSIPMRLTTDIQLEVSGKEREIHTGTILPDGFVPLSLNSPLPARLESDGSLRIQVKPGRWNLELTTRHLGAVDTIMMPVTTGPWSKEEIWSVQTINELRVVTIEGGTAIDPAQTAMPNGWKRLPAYMVQPGQKLHLITRKRGNNDPVAAQISLRRTLWLDFDGQGYTARDHISGQLGGKARIEAGKNLQLGRVTVDGKDQFITRLTPKSPSGIEVRRQRINVEAESRISADKNNTIAAVGWALDPTSLHTQLNLPPGWRLIEALGPDSASSTWLRNWSLLDIFIVLVLTLSFARLWGPLSGLGALLGLAIIYHEPHAPQLVWLNVLIPIALLRVLPAGMLRQLTLWYRNAALLILLVICLIFSVQQVRTAIYPQLEPQINRHQRYNIAMEDQVSPGVGLMKQVATRAMSSAMIPPLSSSAKLAQRQPMEQYDPDLKIPTGPGIPQWQWRRVELNWNGPVSAGQQLQLYLLPPLFTRLMLLSGVILLVFMFVRLLTSGPLPRWKRELPDSSTPLLMIAIATTVFSATMPVSPAHAAFPDPELLDQLQQRLLRPDSCNPNCIALNRVSIDADGKLLRLRLDYHCQNERAVPLPLPGGQLHLQSARLDDSDNAALYRDKRNKLWAKIPRGIHTLEIYAQLPAQVQRLQLPMPMAAGMVHINAVGWKITGAQDGHASYGSIDMTRSTTIASRQLQPNEIPPFVEVERQIYLGLNWQVRTTVRRISQSGNAIVVHIPLLPDEHVTSRGISVDKRQVLVSLAPDAPTFSWNSSLEKSSQLELLAAQSDKFSEVWQLSSNQIWHISSEGIPIIHHYQHGHWQPQWRPWPGEKLTLTISRPGGIKGQQVTIDNSRLVLTPGSRSTETTLTMKLRSSHGGEHTITLPQQAKLTEVLINSRPQPIKQQKQLVKIPLVPGEQNIELKWQQPRGTELITRIPQLHLGAASVNCAMSINLPHSRWTLFTYGPLLGPAVLFWGVLLVILVLAFILGRFKATPLRWWHWLLLFAGLSQASLPALIPVAAWLLLLGLRHKWQERLDSPWSFNLTQLALALLTFVAMATIVGAIHQGLLGLPQMQVAGNHSSAWNLHWYQDRCSGFLPQAWVLSVPMYIYRILMLLWALWLAVALLKWLQWGWSCYSSGGLWRQIPRRRHTKKQAAEESSRQKT